MHSAHYRSAVGVPANSLSDELNDTCKQMSEAGLIELMEPERAYRFTCAGQKNLRMLQDIGEPRRLFNIEEDKPLSECSSYSLYHFLEREGWVLRELTSKHEETEAFDFANSQTDRRRSDCVLVHATPCECNVSGISFLCFTKMAVKCGEPDIRL